MSEIIWKAVSSSDRQTTLGRQTTVWESGAYVRGYMNGYRAALKKKSPKQNSSKP